MSLQKIIPPTISHDLRRQIFRVKRPSGYAKLVALREKHVEHEDEVSLAPYIQRQAIFVHIPKCAGLSISKAIFGCRGSAHMNISLLQLAFTGSEFQSFYKFSFVRNPWDRLVSAYYFMRDREALVSHRDFGGRPFESFPNFRSFVLDYISESDLSHHVVVKPQYTFICQSNAEAPGFDFIGRYENIAEDYSRVCQRLGTQHTIRDTNRGQSRPRDYRSEYDDEMVEIVGRAYARDIEIFQYSF